MASILTEKWLRLKQARQIFVDMEIVKPTGSVKPCQSCQDNVSLPVLSGLCVTLQGRGGPTTMSNPIWRITLLILVLPTLGILGLSEYRSFGPIDVSFLTKPGSPVIGASLLNVFTWDLCNYRCENTEDLEYCNAFVFIRGGIQNNCEIWQIPFKIDPKKLKPGFTNMVFKGFHGENVYGPMHSSHIGKYHRLDHTSRTVTKITTIKQAMEDKKRAKKLEEAKTDNATENATKTIDPCAAGSMKFLARDCDSNETTIWTLTGEKCFTLPHLPLEDPSVIVTQTLVVDASVLYVFPTSGNVHSMDLLKPFEELVWIKKTLVPDNNGKGRLVKYHDEIIFFAFTKTENGEEETTLDINVYQIQNDSWTQPSSLNGSTIEWPANISEMHRINNVFALMTTYGKHFFKVDLRNKTIVSKHPQPFDIDGHPLKLTVAFGTHDKKDGVLAKEKGTDQLLFLDFAKLGDGFKVFRLEGNTIRFDGKLLDLPMAHQWDRSVGYDLDDKDFVFWRDGEEKVMGGNFPKQVIDKYGCCHLYFAQAFSQSGPIPPHSRDDSCFPGEPKFLSRNYWSSELAMISYDVKKCFTLPFLRLRHSVEIYYRSIVVDHAILFILTAHEQMFALRLFQKLDKMAWMPKAPLANPMGATPGRLIQHRRELIFFVYDPRLLGASINVYSIPQDTWTNHGKLIFPTDSRPGSQVPEAAIHLPGSEDLAVLSFSRAVAVFNLKSKEITKVQQMNFLAKNSALTLTLNKGLEDERFGLLVRKTKTTELHFVDFANIDAGFELLTESGIIANEPGFRGISYEDGMIVYSGGNNKYLFWNEKSQSFEPKENLDFPEIGAASIYYHKSFAHVGRSENPCLEGGPKFLARECETGVTSVWSLTGSKCFTLPYFAIDKPEILSAQSLVLDSSELLVVPTSGPLLSMDLLQPIDKLSWSKKATVPVNVGNGRLLRFKNEIIFLAPTTENYDQVKIEAYNFLTDEWTSHGQLTFKDHKSGRFQLAGFHPIDRFWPRFCVISTYGTHGFKFDADKKKITDMFKQKIQLDGPPVYFRLSVSENDKPHVLLAMENGLLASDKNQLLYFLRLTQLHLGYKPVDAVGFKGPAIKVFSYQLETLVTHDMDKGELVWWYSEERSFKVVSRHLFTKKCQRMFHDNSFLQLGYPGRPEPVDKCIPGERKFLARDPLTYQTALLNFKAVKCLDLPFLKVAREFTIYHQTLIVDNRFLFVVATNGPVNSLDLSQPLSSLEWTEKSSVVGKYFYYGKLVQSRRELMYLAPKHVGDDFVIQIWIYDINANAWNQSGSLDLPQDWSKNVDNRIIPRGLYTLPGHEREVVVAFRQNYAVIDMMTKKMTRSFEKGFRSEGPDLRVILNQGSDNERIGLVAKEHSTTKFYFLDLKKIYNGYTVLNEKGIEDRLKKLPFRAISYGAGMLMQDKGIEKRLRHWDIPAQSFVRGRPFRDVGTNFFYHPALANIGNASWFSAVNTNNNDEEPDCQWHSGTPIFLAHNFRTGQFELWDFYGCKCHVLPTVPKTKQNQAISHAMVVIDDSVLFVVSKEGYSYSLKLNQNLETMSWKLKAKTGSYLIGPTDMNILIQFRRRLLYLARTPDWQDVKIIHYFIDEDRWGSPKQLDNFSLLGAVLARRNPDFAVLVSKIGKTVLLDLLKSENIKTLHHGASEARLEGDLVPLTLKGTSSGVLAKLRDSAKLHFLKLDNPKEGFKQIQANGVKDSKQSLMAFGHDNGAIMYDKTSGNVIHWDPIEKTFNGIGAPSFFTSFDIDAMYFHPFLAKAGTIYHPIVEKETCICKGKEPKFLAYKTNSKHWAFYNFKGRLCFEVPPLEILSKYTISYQSIVVDDNLLVAVSKDRKVYAMDLTKKADSLTWQDRRRCVHESERGALIQYKRKVLFFVNGKSDNHLDTYDIDNDEWEEVGELFGSQKKYIFVGVFPVPSSNELAIVVTLTKEYFIFDLEKMSVNEKKSKPETTATAILMKFGMRTTEPERTGILALQKGTRDLIFYDFDEQSKGFAPLMTEAVRKEVETSFTWFSHKNGAILLDKPNAKLAHWNDQDKNFKGPKDFPFTNNDHQFFYHKAFDKLSSC